MPTAPDDYTALISEPVVIVAGSTSNCVTLNIIDDDETELLEDFQVHLDSNDDAVVISPFQYASVDITDNDQR